MQDVSLTASAVIGLILFGFQKQPLSVHISCSTSNPIRNTTIYSSSTQFSTTAQATKIKSHSTSV